MLLRKLVPSDLTSFDKFAPRVKELKLDSSQDPKFLIQLAALRRPLFPCLDTLSWNIDLHSVNILPVLCPSVLYFTITDAKGCILDCDPSISFAAVTQRLPASLPRLQSFVCDVDMYDVPLNRGRLFDAIGAFSTLVSLRLVDTVDIKLLMEISKMPNLQDLVIALGVRSTLVLTSSQSSFPALVGLRVMALGDTPDIRRMLASITSQHLRSLHILLRGNIDAYSFTTAAKAFPLTAFGLIGRGESHTAIMDFEPLFSCNTLKYFEITSSDTTVEASDRDIASMAGSWPFLQSLKLPGAYKTATRRPTTTLQALHTLAEHCPHLKELQIPVDTSIKFKVPSKRVLPQLRYLNLGSSVCGRVESVVGFFKSTFPALEILKVKEWDPDMSKENVGKWTKVASRLPSLRSVPT